MSRSKRALLNKEFLKEWLKIDPRRRQSLFKVFSWPGSFRVLCGVTPVDSERKRHHDCLKGPRGVEFNGVVAHDPSALGVGQLRQF
jgi:hypothetical protein